MINLKSPLEIEKMAESGRILAKILAQLAKEAKIGVQLSHLNKLAFNLTEKEKAEVDYKLNLLSKKLTAY